MKGIGKSFGKLWLGMFLLPLGLGAVGLQVFASWNPFDKAGQMEPKNDEEKLELEVMNFRNDWTKNKKQYMDQINKKSQDCNACKELVDGIDNSTYELPEVIQRVFDILEEKNETKSS